MLKWAYYLVYTGYCPNDSYMQDIRTADSSVEEGRIKKKIYLQMGCLTTRSLLAGNNMVVQRIE